MFNFQLSIKHFGFIVLIAATMQGCYISQPVPSRVVQREVIPPQWAPSYQNQSMVQYYYMPDIEVYYDVWNHEFVYLENGNWVFEPSLPPMYGGYDLYGGHIVILNYSVHEPWRHHELYSSHYPKYYNHSVNSGNNGEYSTGFDENTHENYYCPRTNAPSSNGNNQRTNSPSSNGNNQRPNAPTPSNGPRTNIPPPSPPRNNTPPPVKEREARTSGTEQNHIQPARQEPISQPRKTQPVQYNEKMVGRPVRVQKNMARPKGTAEPKKEMKR